jgi:hypothetical protein
MISTKVYITDFKFGVLNLAKQFHDKKSNPLTFIIAIARKSIFVFFALSLSQAKAACQKKDDLLFKSILKKEFVAIKNQIRNEVIYTLKTWEDTFIPNIEGEQLYIANTIANYRNGLDHDPNSNCKDLIHSDGLMIIINVITKNNKSIIESKYDSRYLSPSQQPPNHSYLHCN